MKRYLFIISLWLTAMVTRLSALSLWGNVPEEAQVGVPYYVAFEADQDGNSNWVEFTVLKNWNYYFDYFDNESLIFIDSWETESNPGTIVWDAAFRDWINLDRTRQYVTLVAASNNAQFISQSFSGGSIEVGSTRQYSVTFKNTGGSTWSAGSNFRLGSQNSQDNTVWGFSRVNLGAGETVAPNGQKTFTFNVTAPAHAGTYHLQWRMVQDGVAWFGDTTPNISVTVVDPPPPQPPGDSDGDGMPDWWETAYGLNPYSAADALADLDGDGLSNLVEYLKGLNPASAADGFRPAGFDLKIKSPSAQYYQIQLPGWQMAPAAGP